MKKTALGTTFLGSTLLILGACTPAGDPEEADAATNAMPEDTQCVVIWRGDNEDETGEQAAESADGAGETTTAFSDNIQMLDPEEGAVVLFSKDPCDDVDLNAINDKLVEN